MRKLIMFDFDGTIADTIDIMYEMYVYIANKHNMKIVSKEDVHAYRKVPLKKRIKEQGIRLYQLPKLFKDAHKIQHTMLSQAKPFEGIQEVLETLKKEYTLIIVSSNQLDFITSFLQTYHLDMFDHVFGGAKLFGKARKIKNVLKQLGYHVDDVIYIGDETRDIIACQKIKVPIISVSYGYDDVTLLKETGATDIATSPHELLGIIDRFVKS